MEDAPGRNAFPPKKISPKNLSKKTGWVEAERSGVKRGRKEWGGVKRSGVKNCDCEVMCGKVGRGGAGRG